MSDLSFIEVQFPVSRVSKESYKERKANYSQTLTGLGKWWGRKPLILVRATILGLIMPASDQPEKDAEIFRKILCMDSDGLWKRRSKPIPVGEIVHQIQQGRLEKGLQKVALQGRLPGVKMQGKTWREDLLRDFFVNTEETWSWKRGLTAEEKDSITRLAFEGMSYDERLTYCDRPEQIDGPDPHSWDAINAHLGTSAKNLPDLFQELGKKRFGHVPRVGDAFCGGGSIPFEAARMGLPVFASDLNPVAALLTWAALHIIGGGPEVAKQVRDAQEKIYDEVDRQICEWGIEHNEKGHRADAYLYCVEVTDPETGWKVPLAPSWVIGEKTKTVAQLVPDKKNKRYAIHIKMGASEKEMAAAKEAGTVRDNSVVHPNNPNPVSMSLIRRENAGGLRLWENEDVIPREGDVFQERLYCIRYVESWYELKSGSGKPKRLSVKDAEALPDFEALKKAKKLTYHERRYYTAPDDQDLARESRTQALLQERFKQWQAKGFIPSRKIESGYNTDQPIRERGWTHWHHLFNPRHLVYLGTLQERIQGFSQGTMQLFLFLLATRCADYSSRLSQWHPNAANEKVDHVFANQALNTLMSFGSRTWLSLSPAFRIAISSYLVPANSQVQPTAASSLGEDCELWITDPPYADAINYHELSEFFLAWYEKHILNLFPDWYTDSKRALAIRGQTHEFRRSMVEAYTNLARHMPDNGMQVVMFTHQDASVWADLALILWAAGLRVTAAWTIGTETDSALKEGNYVQGTVLLILRKQTSEETAFRDDLIPLVDREVKLQIDRMRALEDKEEPNFSDSDYQLAAYAAALRILTQYKSIEDIDVSREIQRERGKGDKNPLESIIENGVAVAANYLIPQGMEASLWRLLTPEERLYIKGLDVESRGEYRAGVYQELARGYGVRNYKHLLAGGKANRTRLMNATEFGTRSLRDDAFGTSLIRRVLFAIRESVRTGGADAGKNYLRTELPDYFGARKNILTILRYLGSMGRTIESWKKDGEVAEVLAGLIENDRMA